MPIKLQYNPSTGKVSYNPATGKVQVFNTTVECGACSEAPKTMQVTISDLVLACCNVPDLGVDYSASLDSNITSLLEGTFTFDVTGGTDDYCRWFKTLTVPAETYYWRGYDSTDCSAPPYEDQVFEIEAVTLFYFACTGGPALFFIRTVIKNTGPQVFQVWDTAEIDEQCIPTESLVEMFDCDNWGEPAWGVSCQPGSDYGAIIPLIESATISLAAG